MVENQLWDQKQYIARWTKFVQADLADTMKYWIDVTKTEIGLNEKLAYTLYFGLVLEQLASGKAEFPYAHQIFDEMAGEILQLRKKQGELMQELDATKKLLLELNKGNKNVE